MKIKSNSYWYKIKLIMLISVFFFLSTNLVYSDSESYIRNGVVYYDDDTSTAPGSRAVFPFGFWQESNKGRHSSVNLSRKKQVNDHLGPNELASITYLNGSVVNGDFQYIDDFMDECTKWDIPLVIGTYGPDPSLDPTINDPDFKKHDAILGWYHTDDADRNYTADEVVERNRVVKAIDNKHVTFISTNVANLYSEENIAIWEDYGRGADVIMDQHYPIGWRTHIDKREVLLWTYEDALNVVEGAGRINKVPMTNLQTYIYPESQGAVEPRWPSAEELDAMTYISISAGVKGIYFYTFGLGDPQTSSLDYTQPDLFNKVASLGREIAQIEYFLLYGDHATGDEDEGERRGVWGTWVFDDIVYIIVTNPHPDLEDTIAVPMPINVDATVNKMFPDSRSFGSTRYHADKNTLDVTLPKMSTQIYWMHADDFSDDSSDDAADDSTDDFSDDSSDDAADDSTDDFTDDSSDGTSDDTTDDDQPDLEPAPSGNAALPNTSAITGAEIDESSVSQVIHVNGATGDDNNPGTSASASLEHVRTAMNRAMEYLNAGQGVKILVYPGTYRETLGTLKFTSDAAKDAPLIIEGTEPGQVIFSGSDEFAPSQWTHLGNGLYEHAWEHDFGQASAPGSGAMPELRGHRREMVFINGELLKQVILEDYTVDSENKRYIYRGFLKPQDTLTPGSYGVAERSENGNKIFLKIPEEIDWNSAVIEVATRTSFARVNTRNNTVFRNLTFQHFAGGHQQWNYNQEAALYFPAWADGHQDTLIDNCDFRWNNWSGFGHGDVTDLTISNSRFLYNGGSGFHFGGGHGAGNHLLVNNETSFNNWRGNWGGKRGWYIGGVKLHTLTGQIVRDHLSLGNLASGYWYDIHCKDVHIDGLVSIANKGQGLFLEISYGPFLVENAIMADNSVDFTTYTVGEATIRNNIVMNTGNGNPERSAVRLVWYPREGNAHWEQDPFLPGHHSLLNNVFLSLSSNQALWRFANNPKLPAFKDGYEGAGNIWYNPAANDGQFYFGNWGKTWGNYPAWVDYIGDQEQAPRWIDPQFTNPERFDFRPRENSPLRENRSWVINYRLPEEKIDQMAAFSRWVEKTDQ